MPDHIFVPNPHARQLRIQMEQPESNYKERLDVLSQDLQTFMDEVDEESEDEEPTRAEYLSILHQITEVVHEAQAANSPDLHELVKQAETVLNQGINFGYGDEERGNYGLYGESCIPSFAHQEDATPLLQVPHKESEASHMFVGGILPELGGLLKMFGANIKAAKASMKLPPAWKTTLRPHPLSTSCARFLDSIPDWSMTDGKNIATAVFEARCEVSSGDIIDPIDLKMSPSGNILALSSMAGWKKRTPYISYYLPNHEETPHLEDFIPRHIIKADLTSILCDITTDDERRLIFAADYDRVKSYRCKEPNVRGRTKRVHTMDSKGYEGPLAMLSNGRMLRTGKDGVAFWNLDALETHGESGTDIIGTKITEVETWRDDPESIERSSGSQPSGTITLENDGDGDGFKIGKWHPHPSQSNVMICASERRTNKYFCHAFDVEVGGKAVTRYLGHGGTVVSFSTSVAADPNVFLTWCDDGHARLYDTRFSLPVLTIAAEMQLMPSGSAALAHPDGIPFIFTGASQSEAITLWDVRAQKRVYELATGNNAICSMAWDSHTSTLYAASLGQHDRYRPAKIPIITEVDGEVSRKEKKQNVIQGEGEVTVIEDVDVDEWKDFDDQQDDEDDDEDEDDRKSDTEYEPVSEDICWPTRAYHAENYFGHVFDAGHNRLFKYSFKIAPDPEILPHYGAATVSSMSSRSGLW